MDETATRRKKIDPKLYEVGWVQVPESDILTEQQAYEIAPGRVSQLPQNRHTKKVDYILEYKKQKLAVIEAKKDELPVSAGMEQAKKYAKMLQIRFTYACNGDEIWTIDMGVKDALGNYIVPFTEGPVDKFHSLQELWAMTFPEKNEWRDKFNLCPMNRGGGRESRYYQEIAINNVLRAISEKKPRILFISDRNILANQAKNDFEQFPEDAMERITPELLHDKKYRNRAPETCRHSST